MFYRVITKKPVLWTGLFFWPGLVLPQLKKPTRILGHFRTKTMKTLYKVLLVALTSDHQLIGANSQRLADLVSRATSTYRPANS